MPNMNFNLIQKATFFGLLCQTATLVATPQSLPAPKVIQPTAFCERLTLALLKTNLISAPSRSEAIFAARDTALELTDQIRSGAIAEYIPVSSIQSSAPQGNPAQSQYVALAALLQEPLGIADDTLIAHSAEELKFLPFMQKGSEILLMAESTESFTPERAQLVANAAKQLAIKINIIWYGKSPVDSTNDRQIAGLVYISALTGGHFLNMGGEFNPCKNRS